MHHLFQYMNTNIYICMKIKMVDCTYTFLLIISASITSTIYHYIPSFETKVPLKEHSWQIPKQKKNIWKCFYWSCFMKKNIKSDVSHPDISSIFFGWTLGFSIRKKTEFPIPLSTPIVTRLRHLHLKGHDRHVSPKPTWNGGPSVGVHVWYLTPPGIRIHNPTSWICIEKPWKTHQFVAFKDWWEYVRIHIFNFSSGWEFSGGMSGWLDAKNWRLVWLMLVVAIWRFFILFWGGMALNLSIPFQ